jgi:FkbM family methyltransferase
MGPTGGRGPSAGARRIVRPRGDPYVTFHAPPRPALTIHLYDRESFHHALPVWYRGDAEATIVQRLVEPGRSYIDAGASFGVYALYAAMNPEVTVCAIEPQPHLIEAIQRSARANAMRNLNVVEAAVAQEDGSTDLIVHRGGSGSASVDPGRDPPSARRVRVRAVTLDSVVAAHGLAPVGLLKLDVENAETIALQGARELLARDAPFLLFEAGAMQPQSEVFDLLRAAGYDRFYDERSVHERALVPPRLDQELTNIVAVPRGGDAARILTER